MYYAPPKDPDAVLPYDLTWSGWLGAGERITSSTWIVETGITKDSDSFTDTITIIWLSGGTAGERYEVTNRITTSEGKTEDRTLIIQVEDR